MSYFTRRQIDTDLKPWICFMFAASHCYCSNDFFVMNAGKTLNVEMK